MATHNAFRQAFVTASFRRNVSIVLGLSSLTTPLISSCEDKSFIDKIIAKDRSGNIDWNASLDTVAVEAGKSIQGAIDSGYPTQLSYGFVMGYCSGYALKKVGKIAAVVLGEFQCVTTQNKTIACVLDVGVVVLSEYIFTLIYHIDHIFSGTGFVALQSLQYSGYIKVDHSAIKSSVEGMMDLNKDGKVDQEDMEQASGKLMEVLQFNMPGGGGFAAGFVGGIRSG